MRFRVAVGGIAHETAGVLDGVTLPGSPPGSSATPTFDSFESDAKRGAEQMTPEATIGTQVAGYLQGCAEQDLEAVPLYHASGGSGGPIAAPTLARVIEELLAPLRAALPVDGVLLALHGSFAAQGADDADAEVLAAVRGVVGPDVPVYAALDQHCNISQLMIDSADVLSVMRTYPHVDGSERALRCTELMKAALEGTATPKMAWCSLPILWHPQRMLSGQAPFLDIVRVLEELCPSHADHPMFSSAADMVAAALPADPPPTASAEYAAADAALQSAAAACELLDVSVGVGYQWIDSPTVGACALAVVDGSSTAAQTMADALAGWVWSRRQEYTSEVFSVEGAIAQAEEVGRFPAILADGGDNTGGGAPGDGTAILRRFLETPELWPACVLYIVDPEAAAAAHAAGAGATASIAVGGKSHPKVGPPVQMEATVEAVSDGRFVFDTSKRMAGAQGDLGPSALLVQGGVSVIVVSKPGQPMDLSMSRSLGLDVTTMRYISVKSTGHFRDGFEPIAGSLESIFIVDHAGQLFTFDYSQLGFQRFGRPLFPIDEDAAFAPGASVAPGESVAARL